MSRSVSQTLKSEVFAQEMSDVPIILITISHNDLSEDVTISSDPTETLSSGAYGTTSNGIEYTQLPFEIVLAEQSDNLLTRATIKIDNVSRAIMSAVRAASNEPPEVKVQIVLATDPDTVEVEIDGLLLNDIKATALVVEAYLEPEILQAEKYPKNTINQSDYPGVFG